MARPKHTERRHEYCKTCENYKPKGIKYYSFAFMKIFFVVVIGFLAAGGIMFLEMVLVNPSYIIIPGVAVSSFYYTEMASEFHQEVQGVADNITKDCKEEGREYSSDFFDFDFEECLVKWATFYMVDNFVYENDWEYGHAMGTVTENMITSRRKKGDCIDFAVTFCSIMKHLDISCIVRSPNGYHRISLININDKWIPLEPQLVGESGYLHDDRFQGFLI